MRRDLAKRLEVLEAKAKPRVISTWADFMMCEDDEVELSPEPVSYTHLTLPTISPV